MSALIRFILDSHRLRRYVDPLCCRCASYLLSYFIASLTLILFPFAAGMAVLIDQFPAARNKDLECTTTCNATVTTNCTTCPTTLFTSDNGVPYTIALV